MATRTATYNTRQERQSLIAAAEATGEVMLHDEVRNGVKTLVFGTEEDLPPPITPPQPERDWRDEFSNAADLDARVSVIAQRLGLV